MIQNKVVADLLQHRERLFALYTGMHRDAKGKQQLSTLLASVLDGLVRSLAIMLRTTVGEDVKPLLPSAFRGDNTEFALPFSSFSIIDMQDEDVAVTFVRGDVDPGAVTCAMFIKVPNKSWEPYAPIAIKATGKADGGYTVDVNMLTPTYYTTDKDLAGTKEELHVLSNIVVANIGSINAQCGACAVRMPLGVKPGTSLHTTAKNKALWEYHEVKLSDVPGYISQPKGGTHASPRWHMRRGHWRQYKTGKRVWIENMEVGDKKRGVVAHDYVVTANHMEV